MTDVLWEATGKPLKGYGAGKYKLTHDYLYFERGTLRTDSQQVPVIALADVDVKQSMSQKARGVGTIVVRIQKIGAPPEIVDLVDIPNFREGQEALNRAAHNARVRQQQMQNTHTYQGPAPMAPPAPAPAPVAPAAPAEDDPMAMLKKLGDLRDAGILTDEEFAAKKAEILSRL